MRKSIGSLVKRIGCLLANYKATVAGILTASIFLNLLGLAIPRLTQTILDRVLPQEDLSLLVQVLLVLVLVTSLQIILTIWRRLALVRMSLNIDRVVLSEFLAHMLSLPSSFFTRQPTGDLVARWGDHSHVRHLLAGGMTRVTIDALMVVIYLAVMFAYSLPLALLVVTLLVLFAGFMLFRGPALRRQHRRLLDDKGAQEAHLTEMIAGIDLVKAMSLEESLSRTWQERLQEYLHRNYQTQKLRQLLESGGTVLQYLCVVGLLGIGSVQVMNGQMSPGALVAFSMYTGQAVAPILSMFNLWDEMQLARSALERIEEIRGVQPESRVNDTQKDFPLRGHVRFENVWFSYEGQDETAVLRGVTFEAVPGQRLALVGPSGSGKTTLLRVLLGLCRPTQGRVLIDGVDLATINLQFFRRQIGVVLQDGVLFSGTILSNITLGDSQVDFQRALEAARQAGADDFIHAMPGGYDAVVGERGTILSGGQRQRIALARALYRQPKILILDEPLNAVDHQTAGIIWQNLLTENGGRTLFIITHDLMLARQADSVLVLNAGRIVAVDGFRDLLTSLDVKTARQKFFGGQETSPELLVDGNLEKL